MSRYAHLDDLKDALAGVSLDAWKTTAFGNDSSQQDRLLEGFLEQADSWADGAAHRVFTPLAQRMDQVNGNGGTSLTLPGSPIVDVQSLQIMSPPLMPSITVPTSALRIDRSLGRLTIVPGLQLAAPAVVGMPSWSFPRGLSNVLAQYRTGYAVVGNNLSAAALLSDPWPTIAVVTTDATYAYFTLFEDFAFYKSGETVANRSAGKMLKDSSDDSANWTMVSPRQLRCPIASYGASAKYVFVFIPAGLSQAVVAKATADVLRDKGAKDGSGAGGAISVQAGPFKEDYGEMKYAGQIRALEADAEQLIRPFKKALVVFA